MIPLENEKSSERKKFERHFGNLYCAIIIDGDPLICVGPHWMFSLCLFLSLGLLTYYISQFANTEDYWKTGSLGVGLLVMLMFAIAVLKNPGIHSTKKFRKYKQGMCEVCLVERERGISHCYDCNICIKGHDHHCPWTSKCIGEGNILYFNFFLFSFLFFFIFHLFMVVAGMKNDYRPSQ